mmetsp:Transcript_15684/g.47286  ORF Transcript_15684/g.47286 Transcript_15684/m.47286 type:complete len:680 (+) Transcript_15684:107-2146(+)
MQALAGRSIGVGDCLVGSQQRGALDSRVFSGKGCSSSSRGQLVVTNVATPSRPPTSQTARRGKVEIIKENSDYLRHPLMQDLVTEATNIGEESVQLMKFHGSYQQDDRERRTGGKGKFYQFMMRTRQPAGHVTNQLYLVMDDLADLYGNGTLRLTTRQCYQLHGVLKGDLKTVFSSVIKSMGSTLGACGDVNRNVMAAPAPWKDRKDYLDAERVAEDVANLLAPQAGAYYDVWLDGEKWYSETIERPHVTEAREFNGFGTNFVGSPEPIYGGQYLPRKFKIGVTVPGDNSIDVLTNDVAIVVISDDAGETIGYDLLVGGGMGRTHRNNDTFPRLADPLGFVPKEDILHAIKAIVATQRDYGRRDDRRQARLKYLVADWGMPKFRSVVEQYYGKKFQAFKPLPDWEFRDYLGWQDQGDGRLAYGVFVQNGRLKGETKKALRQVIERYELPVRLTANQNLILLDVEPAWKTDIATTLGTAGVRELFELDSIERQSMACPALPLCGLAIGEAERSMPDVNRRVRALLDRLQFPPDFPIVVRMTGCPNGCARPYMAELGLVGDGPNSYQIWLGAAPNQSRMAEEYQNRVKMQDLEKVLEPLLFMFKEKGRSEEAFGDFCARVGFEALRAYSAAYVPPDQASSLAQVGLRSDTHDRAAALAAQQGKSMSHVVNEAIERGLAHAA